MKVFISHSSKEKWVARKIAEDIQRLGAKTFLDEKDINTGQPIDESIRKHLKESDHFLLLLSPSSLSSHWVLIELGGAMALGKHIVPILLYLGANDIPQPITRFLARDINDIEKYYTEIRQVAPGKGVAKAKPKPPKKPVGKAATKPPAADVKFKPGDRVRIQVSPEPEIRQDLGWNNAMDRFCGKVVTVKGIATEQDHPGAQNSLRIEEDGGEFFWAFEWLQHAKDE